MTIGEKKRELVSTLAGLKSGPERLAYLVRQARLQPALDAAWKTDAFLVEGCLAKVWFVPSFAEGRCYFKTDSDSAVVKGIAALLCDFYSGQSPADIIATDPSFLKPFGINQHLTPNRRNSLAKVWEKIRAYAESSAHDK